jgi:predicted RNA-binding protein with PUA-like domain
MTRDVHRAQTEPARDEQDVRIKNVLRQIESGYTNIFYHPKMREEDILFLKKLTRERMCLDGTSEGIRHEKREEKIVSRACELICALALPLTGLCFLVFVV